MTIWTKFVRSLRNFGNARAGNVAITFALATLPIVGTVGFAVDYSRANQVKAAMQAALDSTALMLSRDAATLSNEDLQTKASTYFKAMFTPSDATDVTVNATYTTTGGSQVVVNGAVAVPTTFLGIIGHKTLDIEGSSTAAWGSTRLRVALALDNTGSMAQSGKMDALKSATKDLLTQLQSAATKDGDVYVSIVPFSKDVNVGSGNKNANWVSFDYLGQCSVGNNDNRNSCESIQCSKSQYSSKNGCENNNGRWAKGVWTPKKSNWNGCVMDRDKAPTAYNVTNAPPAVGTPASLFPAEQFSSCPESMMVQSFNWTSLRNKIDDMTPVGNTNTTIGLVHGWQTLSDGAPYFPPPLVNSDGIETRKILIFLTDGENTQDRFDSNSNNIDDRMRTACTNAKADNVTIFTILVMQGNENLLKSCASPDDAAPKGPKYFKLTAASQIAGVFQQIGTSLSNLRVAK